MIKMSTDELRVMLADPDPDIRWKARMLVLLPVAGYLDGAAGAQDVLAVPRALRDRPRYGALPV